MAKGIEVAQAYVTITPSMEGIQKSISNELVPAAEKAGDEAGDAIGEGIEEGGAKSGEELGKQLQKGVGRSAADVARDVQGTLTSKFSEMGSRISGRFRAIGSGISGTFSRVGAAISGSAFGTVFSGIADRARTAFANVTGTVRGVGGFISTTLGGAASKVGEVFSPIAEKISGAFGAARDKIGPILGDIVSKAANAAKLAAKALVVGLGAAVVSVGKMALDAYSEFEQLEGGVAKIFDEANTDQIMADAQNAYVELNMSANDYLESINQIGATFAQTMGDQRGYDTARIGMMAIADYASGTGRNIDELNEKFSLITRSTSSYQSIADQFSGILPATSDAFLEQAQAAGILSDEYTSLTEVPIDEYQEAVSLMLQQGVDDMGLLGNTAAESTETISGSLAMAKAAWENFLVGLGDEDADLGALTDNLINSITAVGENVVPRLGIIGSRAIAALPGVVSTIAGKVPEMFAGVVGPMLDGISARINSALGTNLDLSGGIGAMFSRLQTTMAGPLSFLRGMFDGLAASIGPLVERWGPLLANLFTNVIAPGVTIVAGVLVGLVTHAVNLGTAIGNVVSNVVGVIKGMIPSITSAFGTIRTTATSIFNGVRNTITGAVNGAKSAVSTAVNAIKGAFNTAKGAISGAVSGIKSTIQGIGDKINSVRDTVSNAISRMKSIISGGIGELPHFKLPHFKISGGQIPWGIGGQGTKPSISVEWYAKGGIFDVPSIIGVGERGPEAVLPIDRLSDLMADAISELGGMGGDTYVVSINGAQINDTPAIRAAVGDFLTDMARIGAM